MKLSLLLFLFIALVLSGCGATQGSNAAATPTVESVATAVVPGMPVGLCTNECVVVDFSVWQDFMPSRSQGSAPLHATATLDIQWTEKVTPASVHGKITLLRHTGEVVATADFQVAQQADDQGLLQPGPQRVVFAMVPQPVVTQLTEGEMLHGSALLMLGGETRAVDLPEVPLLFTH